MLHDLAPERWVFLSSDHVARMQISADIRKSVVFAGYGTEANFDPIGTGFVLECCGYSWFVTAAHVASQLGIDPFYIRAAAGKPKHVDNAKWTPHVDPNVDIAITPLAFREKSRSVGHIPEDAMLTDEQRPDYEVELGNFAYAIGLFSLLPGKMRNLAVVHTGHIAALPSDEAIPVEVDSKKIIDAKGYLVQMPTMPGISGAPVFVRRTKYLKPDDHGGTNVAAGPVALLGVWISSWPGQIAPEIQTERKGTVPVGFGVVVPSERIMEVVHHHMETKKGLPQNAPPSKADSVSRPSKASKLDNPAHRKDFNRLLGAAMKWPKSSDRT